MSLWDLFGLPDHAWTVLFSLSLILILAYFFEEADFGILKTPKISPEKRKAVLLFGAGILAATIFSVIPNNYVARFGSASEEKAPLTASQGSFEPLLVVDDEGKIVFSFFSDTLGELTLAEDGLVDAANSLAEDELEMVQVQWDDLTKEQQAALALAQKSFTQKRYSNSARFFQYAMAEVSSNSTRYSEVRGMATAGYYGAGEHRKGLNFICELYKNFPSDSSRYRHAVHAHIRRIALEESYLAAETAIDALRDNYGCEFDDFTYSWIPIQLGFMETLQRGSYKKPNLRRRDRDRSFAQQYITEKRPFADYLLLMLGEEKHFLQILENYPDSFVYDHALYKMAVSVDPNLDPKFAREFAAGFDDQRTADVVLHVARSFDYSSPETSVQQIEEFFKGAVRIFEDENLVSKLLLDGPRELARSLADEYLRRGDDDPNSKLAARVLLEDYLEEDSEDPPQELLRTAYRNQTEAERKILVLSFRKACSLVKANFESLDFNAAATALKASHVRFVRHIGSSAYEIRTWLDTNGYRDPLPCANSYGRGADKIAGVDMVVTISFLEELGVATANDNVEVISRLALDMHDCHIARLSGKASKGTDLCGALSRALPQDVSFGLVAVQLHDMVYDLAPDRKYKHLFLSALADRRNKEFFVYQEKLQEFVSIHSNTNLIDDVYTELGWYFAQIKEYDLAERYLRHVLDNYEHMNAYDNALYWLNFVAVERGDSYGRISTNVELAAYLAGRRQIERIVGSQEELRMRTPEPETKIAD